MMANRDCKTCKFRYFKSDEISDDCGHHYKTYGVTHYDIPSLSACDEYGLCEFYEKDPDIMDNKQCVEYLEDICKMFVEGSKNCEGQALEYQQKYISAIRYAIAKLQSSEVKA